MKVTSTESCRNDDVNVGYARQFHLSPPISGGIVVETTVLFHPSGVFVSEVVTVEEGVSIFRLL